MFIQWFHAGLTYVECCKDEYFLRFVSQIGVLRYTNSEREGAYPMSFGYLDEAYIMVNHMLLISRRFVLWSTKAAQIGILNFKIFCIRFLSKYSMNQFRSKFIFIRFMFPSQWFHHNCCLCCSWWELKTKLCEKLVPGREIMPSLVLGVEVFTFTSQTPPQFLFCYWHFAHPCRGAK